MTLKEKAMTVGVDNSDSQRVALLCQVVENTLRQYEILKRLNPSVDLDGSIGGEMSSLKRIVTEV